jgi:phage host-nuclease inhibitor protein Gam
MSVVPEDVIKEKDEEIAVLIKEIGDLVNEFKNVAEEDKKAELVDKITEKEKDLRAIRQKKGQFRAVSSEPTKLW